MGSTFSTSGNYSPASNLSEFHEPLPPPRIIDSTGPLMVTRLDIVPQVRAPVNVSTTKRSIPFMIDRKSIKVTGRGTSSIEIVFLYRSDVYVELKTRILGPKVSETKQTLAPSATMTSFAETVSLKTNNETHVELELSDSHHKLFVCISDSIETFKFTWKQDGTCVDILGLYSESGLCAICFSTPSSVGFLPCRHVCVCSACANQTLSSTNNHCPICRTLVSGRIAI